MNLDGSGLVYSTYLGGSAAFNGDRGFAIAVDSIGDAYVTGSAYSTDFPFTLGAYQTTNNGGGDAFVTKLIVPAGPTPTQTATGTATKTATPTATATATATAAATSTGATASATPTATPTPVLTASLSAKPSQINFGNVAATGTSKPKKIKLTNTGTAPAMISDISASAPFTISDSGDGCTRQTIAPKKNCAFELGFAPTTVGTISDGSIDVTYNGTSPSVALAGSGIAATLSAPKSASLGSAAAGAMGKPKTLKVSNNSTVALTLGTRVVGGTDPGSFQITNDQCSRTVLPPKGKCAISVELAPPGGSASGTQTATVTLGFTYGSNNGSASTSLSGKVK